ncbi:MAG: DUF4080 domain-containing protein [Planctomycetes bacterium]|nr:DUF4080 domain-containing protein [Planctomycetota bacterium]
MPSIVLATLNARYHHCAFGLRYLLANMGDLRERTRLLEFTINQPTLDILGAILAHDPTIVGFGVYIWNVDETTRLVSDLKRVVPHVTVVLGGPEVSYETEQQPICQLSDYVITGEADLAFAELCRSLLPPVETLPKSNLSGPTEVRDCRIIHAPVPDLNRLTLPYDLYSETDIAQRVIYVEASRGCPFTCEFCLSALDIPVRQFSLDSFLAAMDQLLARGTRLFKFVDRTFNLNIRVSLAILEFFLERYQPGMFLHFELIPDRLPESLKEVISRFPPGALQFEVGIQTFNDAVSELISRRQDNEQVEQNLTWLREHTSVHVHADLIVGLPGESIESFAAGFDRLVQLAPHEIQAGILKRLRGTPIIRHDQTWQMIYSPHPPYEILSTSLLDFATIQELRRFAKYWDTIANSGNFVETTPLLWQGVPGEPARSPFAEFRCLANRLFQREGQSHGISLSRLVELLFEYLTQEQQFAPSVAAAAIWRDYQRGGRSDKPACLRPYITDGADTKRSSSAGTVPKRQGRRLNGVADPAS